MSHSVPVAARDPQPVHDPRDRPEALHATRALFDRVDALRRELERERFGGGNPTIALDETLPLLELVARVLAAERANADLGLGALTEVRLNPLEDAAEDRARRALASLSFGNFGAAQALLEEAAGRTRRPEFQQRLALWRALAEFQRCCIMTEITALPRGAPEQRVLHLLEQLDRVPQAERDSYRAEVLRLTQVRARACQDPYLQSVWCLLRARRAMAEQEDTLALAWLYRAYRLNAARLASEAPPNEYLAGLLAQARREVLRVVGEPANDEAAGQGGTGESPDGDGPPRALDCYAALAAQLTALWGHDLRREGALFMIAEYHETAAKEE